MSRGSSAGRFPLLGNGFGDDPDTRTNSPEMDAALWRNVRRAPWFLTRRLGGAGLELEWAGTANTVRVRRGEPTYRSHCRPPGRAAALSLRSSGRGTSRTHRARGRGRSGRTYRVRHITQTKRAGPWQLLRICQPPPPGLEVVAGPPLRLTQPTGYSASRLTRAAKTVGSRVAAGTIRDRTAG